MKRSAAFPSQYLGKDDVARPFIATIKSVFLGEIKGEHGTEQKPIMHFNGDTKPMIVNNVNWLTCEAVYGDDSDFWGGKPVEIYVDPNIMFGSKRVGGVRLRIPAGVTTGAALPAQNGATPLPGNDVWSIARAIEECGRVNISGEQLKTFLKSKGLTAYNAVRDTSLVKQFLTSFSEPVADESFGDEAPPESIPF